MPVHPDHCFPHIHLQKVVAVVPLIQLEYLTAWIVENNYILSATWRMLCDDTLHAGIHGAVQFQQMWRTLVEVHITAAWFPFAACTYSVATETAPRLKTLACYSISSCNLDERFQQHSKGE